MWVGGVVWMGGVDRVGGAWGPRAMQAVYFSLHLSDRNGQGRAATSIPIRDTETGTGSRLLREERGGHCRDGSEVAACNIDIETLILDIQHLVRESAHWALDSARENAP